ncbi:hypothetical protein L1857_22000 [Amycolatopsis thermalba]|uniref:Uncharacterized protein n=1 Tax=Amycolatopsis thermalba TaxID=944492 RepID=A0ABY4NZ05_9PSEU|nr:MULTISPECIES: hypothetical protein [Amycolatopsis]UQS25289.1 hypothetical protein L1857_22000 [Amycolatopsis thermalba]
MEKAEGVVRTVHEALGRALDRLRDDPGFRTGLTPGDPRLEGTRVAMTAVVDELEVRVAPVMAAWADMVRRGAGAHPRIAPYHPRVAFAAFVEATRVAHASFATYTGRGVETLLTLSKQQLDIAVAGLDEPPPLPKPTPKATPTSADGPTGRIGARPSAGPRFYEDPDEQRRQALLDGLYERALPLAEAIADTAPAPGSARAGSDSGIPGPYDDVREPWYRRALRRRG